MCLSQQTKILQDSTLNPSKIDGIWNWILDCIYIFIHKLSQIRNKNEKKKISNDSCKYKTNQERNNSELRNIQHNSKTERRWNKHKTKTKQIDEEKKKNIWSLTARSHLTDGFG